MRNANRGKAAVARSKRGVGSVRKLPSGRYQARITGPDLMRHPAPVTFESKALAEAWIGREVDRMSEPGEWIPPRERYAAAEAERARIAANRVTFESYSERFLLTRKVKGKSLEASTVRIHRSCLKNHILPTFGHLMLEEITPRLANEWYLGLPESKKIRREAYSLARSIMGQAVSVHGPLTGAQNPFAERGAGSGASPKRNEFVERTELDVILETIRPEWRLMVQLAAWCGLRFQELAALRRSDIDLKAGVIRVRRALAMPDRADRYEKAPKSEAGIRDQRIPESIAPDLKAHLNGMVTGRNGLVFPSARGGYIHPSVFYGKPKRKVNPKTGLENAPAPRSWYAARNAAGRPDLHFHDLRATGATLLARNGASVAEVQEWLGDSTPSAALRYVRATSARMESHTDRLSQLAASGDW